MAGRVSDEISESMQMYVKAIHEVQTRKGAARVKDIAEVAGVKKASASAALRTLSTKGLVNYAPYDIVTLTDDGVTLAEELDRRYETLRRFFVEVLGLPAAIAEADACSLEHQVSPELLRRLTGFIRQYETGEGPRFRWVDDAGGFRLE